MKAPKFIYNKYNNKAVDIYRIREITIYQDNDKWEVRGWFNNSDFFSFGYFSSQDNAKHYLDGLLEQLK